MEVRYKNEYVRDLDTIKEMLAWSNFKSPIRIATLVLIAVGIIQSVTSYLHFHDNTFLVSLVIWIIFIFLLIFLYKKRVKLYAARDKEVSGGKEEEITVSLYDDKMAIEASSGGSVEVAYSSLKKIYTTKNLIIALSGARLMYILKKDSFTVGSADECVAFLKSKIKR
ncbi:MAG: YcxB family protein [Clostridia bacterium]|nr:YcxB family protein [Clostridia bacterium]